MGSNFNYRGFTNDPASFSDAGGGGRPPGNLPLTRQPSVYSLTFDELQSTIGGSLGKEFGSMNMDELLKNIWSAEETQTMAAAGSSSASGVQFQEGLQKQGSLTLPRMLSQKTVDEVWKDISKEFPGWSSISNGGPGGQNFTQKQHTLGEMTLEEFLVRAGVVREDNNTQLGDKVGADGGYFGNPNPADLGNGFQQNGSVAGFSGKTSSISNSSQVSLQLANLPLGVDEVRLNHAQAQAQAQQHHHQKQQEIFLKQANEGYATQVASLQNSPAFRGGVVGIGDQGISTGLIPGGGMGLVRLGCVTTGWPAANQFSSDEIGKNNGGDSSVSPVPVFNGGWRGRRAVGTVEKVADRRQRRMIKNRESAARSRARKQAYTMELEAEIAKLKEENQDLQKKQAEIMEMQTNQVMEMMNKQKGDKRQCLRRTRTGPW